MQKLSIDRGIISFIWRARYYKIAVTPSGYRLLANENSGYRKAASDPFFKPLLPDQSYNGLSLVRPFMTPMKTPLIFQEQSGEMSTLKSLFDEEFLSHMPEKIQKFVGEHKVHIASSHGDVHQGNMFEYGGKPTLIDWGGYRERFWRRYDEVHFHFCDLFDSGMKFVEIVSDTDNVLKQMNAKILLSQDDLITYVLCRNEMEATQDRVISPNLYTRRIPKYIERVEVMIKDLES